ncbi:hypothetical protein PPERSA_05618 [Pseudocohnilembus persalinus]|uniref:Uncharacterized protein n=1 Tax=Pseudocohnilembus persalinus TaxID=266149 RepID=A0A0V0QGA1_PSEPJ|nr:hypothetical protein PPERSA_05618 [Pseudocohnilembus persalinus]|eukprot:KRX01218.1 hypothetical protein PPERSA_05618 [Pseudocohnilembus persalinus]
MGKKKGGNKSKNQSNQNKQQQSSSKVQEQQMSQQDLLEQQQTMILYKMAEEIQPDFQPDFTEFDKNLTLTNKVVDQLESTFEKIAKNDLSELKEPEEQGSELKDVISELVKIQQFNIRKNEDLYKQYL